MIGTNHDRRGPSLFLFFSCVFWGAFISTKKRVGLSRGGQTDSQYRQNIKLID